MVPCVSNVTDPIKPDEPGDVDLMDIVNLLRSHVTSMQNLQEGNLQVCVFTISGLLYYYSTVHGIRLQG